MRRITSRASAGSADSAIVRMPGGLRDGSAGRTAAVPVAVFAVVAVAAGAEVWFAEDDFALDGALPQPANVMTATSAASTATRVRALRVGADVVTFEP
ncbi:hypothetical protein GCM10009838_66930 [Catenulispora subtropica]|uniref:Uncharacterized protein n=1 Tax=Catenulispora subtropica TaxID=450798 RepID=A0ABN2SWL8_9ACTN